MRFHSLEVAYFPHEISVSSRTICIRRIVRDCQKDQQHTINHYPQARNPSQARNLLKASECDILTAPNSVLCPATYEKITCDRLSSRDSVCCLSARPTIAR